MTMLDGLVIWATNWIDSLLIASYMTDYQLGLYKNSIGIITTLFGMVTAALTPVLYASLSRLQNDDKAFNDMFMGTQKILGISCQSTNHTMRMLEEGELDLGLTGKPEKLGSLTFAPVMQVQDIFIATRDYLENLSLFTGQKEKDSFSADDTLSFLKNGVLMLLDRENLTRQYLDRYLKEHTLFPENILETTSMDLLIDFARIGLGIAGVIREFVLQELKDGTFLEMPLPFPVPPREIGFVYRENQIRPQLEGALIHSISASLSVPAL